MKVSRLDIENFRGIRKATLAFQGHTLLIGENNVGKSTICEALDLVLGPERFSRPPVAQEHDFYNADYVGEEGSPKQNRIEVVLTDLAPEVSRLCANNLEHWHRTERRLLGQGELPATDNPEVEPCLRLLARVDFDVGEDEFKGATCFAHPPDADGELKPVSTKIKRLFGFLYLRALRTGSRALSLERGTLLDIILRLKEVRTGLWETTVRRLRELDPPIDESAEALGPILEAIEKRVAEYIPLQKPGRATRLFVSQLTREHLRKTMAFFLAVTADQEAIPFQQVGTGTLNVLVMALLTFIAEVKDGGVIFAMEEPEVALPPHTQRRIIKYLLEKTSQCIVTSHSPYVIERFKPEQILVMRRDAEAQVSGKQVCLPAGIKPSTYRMHLRKAISEAMLGRGVIVTEGLTEQDALASAAHKIESASDVLPLDISGVTILNSGGDGNIGALGLFFKDLGLKTFAFYDNKTRRPEERARIASGFDINNETPYVGIETLMVQETPPDRQWEFLQEMRGGAGSPQYGIPLARPSDDSMRDLTCAVLKATKGDGGAARLLEHCELGEIPPTIKSFLAGIYATFPAPAPTVPGSAVVNEGAVGEQEEEIDG